MRASFIFYAGVVVALASLAPLIGKFQLSALDAWIARFMLVGGGVTAAAALSWPARDIHIGKTQSALDRFVPRYQFHEEHSIRIEAAVTRAYRAIFEVTAREIFLFRTLTAIRRAGRPRVEDILNAPPNDPIVDVALRTTFRMLAEEPGREIVIGMMVIAPAKWRVPDPFDPGEFRDIRIPGFALGAMNFRVEQVGTNACVVSTGTRVIATDEGSRRRFARYWRVIYPGSALIRRMWLRAIRKRALRVQQF